jgi:hypothetical protein
VISALCHPERTHLARGLCSPCYSRRREPQRHPHACEHCGGPFTSSSRKSRFCSLACRPKDVAARERRAHPPVLNPPVLMYTVRLPDNLRREVKCSGCSTVWRQGSSKATHHRRWCSPPCRRRGTRAERAVVRRARAHKGSKWKARRSRIAESFAWVCMLCLEPIDPQLRHPDPNSVSLDHVVPRSAGGRETRTNLWPAHLGCNIARGNGPVPTYTKAMIDHMDPTRRAAVIATMMALGARA